MVGVEIKGIRYPIRFDLYAMEMMEEAFGDVEGGMQAIRKHRRVADVRKMFTIMARSAQSYMGQEETITGEEIKHCDLAEIDRIATAINQEMERSMHVSSGGGNENDEEHQDIFMAQMEAEKNLKNGKADEGTA